MVAVIALSAICGTWLVREQHAVDAARFIALTERATREWNDRAERYPFGLEAAKAAFVASESVSRAEFDRMVAAWRIDEQFPGALGIGFIERVPPGELDGFLARTRADGAPDFQVDAESFEHALAVVKYFAPRVGELSWVGDDYAGNSAVYPALRSSERDGDVAATGAIALRESPTREQGFLALLPVYRNGRPTATEAERTEALLGWVYMPIETSRALACLEETTNGEIESALVESDDFASDASPGTQSQFASISTLTMCGRSWNVCMSSTERFVEVSHGLLIGVAFAGAVVALLVGLLVRSRETAAQRARDLADAMTADLRSLAHVSASQAAELSAMADLARVGAWEYDVVGGGLRWSRQVKAIHEVADDWTPTFESAVAFYPGAAAQTIRELIGRAVEQRESFDAELPFVTARDRSIWVRAIGRPVIEGDRVVRVVGAFQDVTEQRAARASLQAAKDEAESATRTKSQFVAMMSHEIRTPLNGILGVTSLLRETKLDPQQADLLRTLHESGEALLVILNDVLDLSKIEAGRIEFERVPFDLHRVVDDVRRLFAGRAQEKGIGLTTAIRAGVPERVIGDPGRLRQIVLNLVSNAVKFTERGEVRVELSIRESTGRRRGIRIDVVDSGPGMDAATTQRLFQPFVQASASTQRDFGGTGLGLSIAKRLVESMGGVISCSSEPGQGSTFRVELAFEVAKAASEADAAAVLVDCGSGERLPLGLHVLLAEDNPVNQRVAQRMLERMGCTVEIAANGRIAVEAFERGDFDVVLMDWQMPEMDGLEATRRIRELPRQRRVPIVALTANAMSGDIDTCRGAGMDDFIAKPVTMARLYEVLAARVSGNAHRT